MDERAYRTALRDGRADLLSPQQLAQLGGLEFVAQRVVEAGGGLEGDAGVAAAGQEARHQLRRRDGVGGDAAGADTAVAFTEHELRTRPASILAQVTHDEVGDRLDVVVHAPELFALGLADLRKFEFERNFPGIA